MLPEYGRDGATLQRSRFDRFLREPLYLSSPSVLQGLAYIRNLHVLAWGESFLAYLDREILAIHFFRGRNGNGVFMPLELLFVPANAVIADSRIEISKIGAKAALTCVIRLLKAAVFLNDAPKFS
ncbi:MAG: hypothetical protein HS105_10900 [Chloracidobacterium sp.]|nr:hypothetical protein [Chloracidobacterium sp.]